MISRVHYHKSIKTPESKVSGHSLPSTTLVKHVRCSQDIGASNFWGVCTVSLLGKYFEDPTFGLCLVVILYAAGVKNIPKTEILKASRLKST